MRRQWKYSVSTPHFASTFQVEGVVRLMDYPGEQSSLETGLKQFREIAAAHGKKH